MKIDDYKERYCLFIDILGFKDIVEDSVKATPSSKSRPQTSGIYFSLKEIAQGLKYKSVFTDQSGETVPSSRRVTQFSDSVVVSYLADEVGSLADMLYDVLHLQLKLVWRKLLIRGAITKGLLHHDGDFVFGPALNEAAELEKLAMYPRVIIDRELLVSAGIFKPSGFAVPNVYSRNADSLVAMDLDGLFFVDYFNIHPEDFSDHWGDLVEYLLSLREVVKSLASKRQPSIRLKHSWLRQKFNEVAEGLEKSRYRHYRGLSVPEDEEDHIDAVRPFK